MRNRIGSFISASAAALSASCCALPLTLLALGFTNLGIFGVLMRYRPITLPISFFMLGAAFYIVYRPQAEADCARGVCSPKFLRRQRLLVWISAGLMVLFLIVGSLPLTLTMSG